MSLQSCSLSPSKGHGSWGEVPRDWKKANITHVLKKEDPSADYRPVSISSVPVEVVKPMLLEALSQPTKDKKVIWSSQRGFAKGKSCLIDLVAFYDEMSGAVGKGVWYTLIMARPWPQSHHHQIGEVWAG